MFGTNNSDGSTQTGEQPGQAVQPVQSSSQEQGGDDQKTFVSRDEFNQAFARHKADIQGLVDKSASRLDKRVKEATDKFNDLVSLAEASGMVITPEQKTQMREKAITQAIVNPTESSNQLSQNQPVQAGKQEVDPVTADAVELMQSYGVVIDDKDPESKLIDSTTKSPRKFLASVEEAAKAKKERLSRPGGASSVPGAIGAGGQQPNLEEAYKSEMLANRGKGYAVGETIKDKYRKMGLSNVDYVRLSQNSA